jgi:Transposase DDE domain
MSAKLDTPRGHKPYKNRAACIEPVFAQINHNRGIRTLTRRGLTAADSEWKLICATHNLLKVYRLVLTQGAYPSSMSARRTQERTDPTPYPEMGRDRLHRPMLRTQQGGRSCAPDQRR